MSRLNLIDLHSDTLTELYYGKKSFQSNDLHIDLEKIKRYQHYAEVFAIFTKPCYSDEEGYTEFLKIADFFHKLLSEYEDCIAFSRNGKELLDSWKNNKTAAFLAVEDARILGGDYDRIHLLFEYGVRFLTLTWSGETCIGGSWNTDMGLTDFGKQTVRDCFRLGIVPDVSHASVRSIDDVIEIAAEFERPIVATHSNSYAVYDHGRNLSDDHFHAIRKLGGLVGMNMYKNHLTDPFGPPATPETVYQHIDHFMELGGEDTVCFGCDFDGAQFPSEIRDVSSIACIAEILLAHNYSMELIRKIFWKNAECFLHRAFPSVGDTKLFH